MQNFKDGIVPVSDNQANSLIEFARKRLSHLYPSDELDVVIDWWLEHITGISKQTILLNKTIRVDQSSVIHFVNGIEKLETGMPVQYLIGKVDFFGLKFLVTPDILIPRPETEELVDLIVKDSKNFSGRMLDIGSGSGCLGLSLASVFKNSTLVSIDRSEPALDISSKNAKLNQIDNAQFLKIDFLQDKVSGLGKFDLIVSNPPYVKFSEKENMQTQVVNFEPSMALFVEDEDPLVFYKAINKFAENNLISGGIIYVEINEKLGNETKEVFNHSLFSSVDLMNDMSGKHRFIKAVRL